MSAFNLLRCVILRRRRSNKQDPKSVNGGMVRSHTPRHADKVWSCSPESWIAIRDGSAALSPGQLGCVNHGQRLAICRPGETRMGVFDYDMLADATGDFNSSRELKKLSRGSSTAGTMFRGTLVSDEGLETPVAIKKFHHRFGDETSMHHVCQDLKGQVLRHRNLLCPLARYSVRKGKLYMVYEYMVNGSLDQHLFRMRHNPNQGLSWDCRCRIVNGVARGLHHLHRNDAVHGSVKVSNILLDQDMTARLGDFGYSRAISSTVLNGSKTMKLILETNTSLTPECISKTIMGNPISNHTYEMDIFYFGAVILEVICGILESQFLVDRVWAHHRDGNILGAVDAKLAASGDFKKAEAQKLLLVGLACNHPDPKQRPGMGDVIEMLTGRLPLPALPLQMSTCEVAPCG